MLSTPILTNINDKSKIFFAQSPIHFNIQNELGTTSIQSATIEVYIWRGFQQADLPATPNIVFNNINKISPQDNYIAIELHNEIKAFITASNLNKNNPQWSYNTTKVPTTAGEGVYFHIVYKVDAESDKQLGTYFATSGYRYNFEQRGGQYTTYEDVETLRKYAFSINYDKSTINLNTTVGVKEVASLTVTSAATAAGNVTVTLDGTATNVAVALSDTPTQVATKIRATVFTGWTAGGTGTNVTFTANAFGTKTDATYSAGTTGATGTISTTVQGANDSQSGTGANGMILQQAVTPSLRKTQTGVKCLIAYVNRLGLWDTFTPFGKFTENVETKRDEFSSTFRNPLMVNSQIQHLKQNGNPKGVRKFQVNTGLLDENNNYQVREILQSSKVYLVIFGNDTYLAESTGITVDSTVVTVDNTGITIDSDTVTSGNIGFYSKYTQIPVKNSSTNFLNKTKLNDKSSISYNLEFEETNNFINDIL